MSAMGGMERLLKPQKPQANAVDLNIKLMKWRVLPGLEPERMKAWFNWSLDLLDLLESRSVFKLCSV